MTTAAPHSFGGSRSTSRRRASRDFRRLWLGLLASTFGSQFTIVATFLQVYSLTRSTVAVGLIGLVGFLALVVGTLAGGTFLDAFDRRKILITAQVGYLASSGLLFAGAVHGDPPLALIYVAVAGIAATSAIDSPTSAMTPGCWSGANCLPPPRSTRSSGTAPV